MKNLKSLADYEKERFGYVDNPIPEPKEVLVVSIITIFVYNQLKLIPMNKETKDRIKQAQIDTFKHMKAKDIKNRKMYMMNAKSFKDTLKNLKQNDFAIVKGDIFTRAYSNEGLMMEAARVRKDIYSVFVDNSYFDGSVKQ